MELKIYAKVVYGGGIDIRMEAMGERFILENAIEILEKLALEKGWTENYKMGQKIKRAKLNQ